jgi:DNA-binding NtrC family response regulator
MPSYQPSSASHAKVPNRVDQLAENEIIGTSQNIRSIRKIIDQVADTGMNTIVSGETGVGKEIVVSNLYLKSNRLGKPFIKVNCAALPDTLLESELFGYEKGAFTGADRNRCGKFKQADGGVLFLDEIGDMSFHLQSKLLRVLQEGEFSPLGSEASVTSDVWVVAATNRDLEADIAAGKFRADLFYRLSTIKIDIEPLRRRREDIPLLIDHFWKRYAAQFSGAPETAVTPATREKLEAYDWPGNVRQLQNALQRIMVVGDSRETVDEMLAHVGKPAASGFATTSPALSDILEMLGFENWHIRGGKPLPLKRIRKQAANLVEKNVISYALRKTGWNRSRAARILKVSYKTLLLKIEMLNIEPPAEFS